MKGLFDHDEGSDEESQEEKKVDLIQEEQKGEVDFNEEEQKEEVK